MVGKTFFMIYHLRPRFINATQIFKIGTNLDMPLNLLFFMNKMSTILPLYQIYQINYYTERIEII
jgi:hypothetical protein